MIDGKPVLGVILARGGSKRVPRKNVRPLAGKPMIAWTVEAGRASRMIDRLVLSSDDDAIMAAAQEAGCEVPFRRPPELAADDTASAAAALHVLDELKVEDGYLVLLQPTSPMRSADDIDGCVDMCHKSGAVTCASVSKLKYPAEWLVSLDDRGCVQKPFKSDGSDLYVPNGSVYVVDVEWFRENREFWVDGVTLAYETPLSRAIDVDTEEDFLLADALMRR